MIKFSKKYEWILNRYNNIPIGKKTKSEWGFEFDIWEVGNPLKSIAYLKTKTASEMDRKIESLSNKLPK